MIDCRRPNDGKQATKTRNRQPSLVVSVVGYGAVRLTHPTCYAVQIGDDIWVIDAFQKKPKSGIKTPQMDVDRIKQRLKRLKEMLR